VCRLGAKPGEAVAELDASFDRRQSANNPIDIVAVKDAVIGWQARKHLGQCVEVLPDARDKLFALKAAEIFGCRTGLKAWHHLTASSPIELMVEQRRQFRVDCNFPDLLHLTPRLSCTRRRYLPGPQRDGIRRIPEAESIPRQLARQTARLADFKHVRM
jgi:hypothetical protein